MSHLVARDRHGQNFGHGLVPPKIQQPVVQIISIPKQQAVSGRLVLSAYTVQKEISV